MERDKLIEALSVLLWNTLREPLRWQSAITGASSTVAVTYVRDAAEEIVVKGRTPLFDMKTNFAARDMLTVLRASIVALERFTVVSDIYCICDRSMPAGTEAFVLGGGVFVCSLACALRSLPSGYLIRDKTGD